MALQEFSRGTPLIWPADWHVIERTSSSASRFPIVGALMARPGQPWERPAWATLAFEGEVHVFNLIWNRRRGTRSGAQPAGHRLRRPAS